MIKIPDVLYEDVIAEHCAIFAGAGISTEGGAYSSPTFYETIKSKANYPDGQEPPSFPDLMQYFCDHVDGGQRNRLTREAISRIERFCAPDKVSWAVTMFHRILARIPYFNRFVTTNWDPFLERNLNILVSMVEDRDLAFWDDGKRQVLKIHGCITRPYTLVATREDYETCIKRNPLIFNKLRDLITTKTFIFVGYSLRDSDFHLIWNEITSSLGHFRKLAYALDPNATPENIEYWKERGIQVIKEHGIQFAASLYATLEENDLVPNDDLLEFFDKELDRIHSVHGKVIADESDGAFASSMYQDGLQHALTDILSEVSLGKKKEDFEKDLSWAEKQLSKMKKKKDYIEMAYFTGQCEVRRRFSERDDSPIPVYFEPNKLKPTHRFIRG